MSVVNKPLPSNIEAEQAVLGSILIDGAAINQVLEILVADDFYREVHRKIFHAMMEMEKAGDPIDELTLYDRLKGEEWFEEAGGSSWLTFLPEACPSAANAAYYARLVKEKSRQRHVLSALEKGAFALREGKVAPDEIIEQVREMVEQMETTGAERLSVVKASELKLGKPTPSLWGGLFYPGAITQINAAPGAGKSTLCYNLAVYGALGLPFLGVSFKKKLKVLYIDLESPKHLIERKLRDILPDGVENLPSNLHLLYAFTLKDLAKLSRLCDAEHYDLIFFDTQSKVLDMIDENDNADANRRMIKLDRLCKERGCALATIHHTSKSDRKGVYSGRGASAIGASVGVVVNIEALNGEVLRITIPKSRFEGMCTPMHIRKIGDDRFEVHTSTETGSSGFEKFKIQGEILKLWADCDKSDTLESSFIHARMEALGFARRTSERALTGLRLAGKINRLGKGLYSPSRHPATSVTPTPRGSGGMAVSPNNVTNTGDKGTANFDDLSDPWRDGSKRKKKGETPDILL